jgi:hypothetical protein
VVRSFLTHCDFRIKGAGRILKDFRLGIVSALIDIQNLTQITGYCPENILFSFHESGKN